jgi:hypothetical protein
MCLCKHLDESDEVGARKLYDLMLEVTLRAALVLRPKFNCRSLVVLS